MDSKLEFLITYDIVIRYIYLNWDIAPLIKLFDWKHLYHKYVTKTTVIEC